ncbi:type II toxin-antitoxin system RelE/ParE family toxin [Janthinobacterium lividum]
MKAVLIQTPTFVRCIEKIATADELKELEDSILENPEVGSVIRGGGGIRKIRFSIGSQGKSGGGRVIYYYKNSANQVYFLVAYAKSDTENLSKDEIAVLKVLVKEL